MREERCAARVQGFDVTETQTMAAGVRRILNENGRLSLDAEKISDREDLFDAGMTSHATVNVLLAIEEQYGVEFRQRCSAVPPSPPLQRSVRR